MQAQNFASSKDVMPSAMPYGQYSHSTTMLPISCLTHRPGDAVMQYLRKYDYILFFPKLQYR